MTQLNDIKKMYDEASDSISNQTKKIEYLKSELSQIAQDFKRFQDEKTELEFKLKEINEKIFEKEEQIRKIWMPHIAGAEHATLDVGGFILETKPKLNVAVEERSQAISWLMEHGYKDAMKWDLHTQTMYKIAREHYEKAETIPGLTYKYFQMIKIK